jgi:hypothetical protein
MAHSIQIPDELYEAIERYAVQRGQTPEHAILAWAAEIQRQVEERQHPDQSGVVAEPHDPYDPWAGFRGAFEAAKPDVVRRHDAYLAEDHMDSHESEEPLR